MVLHYTASIEHVGSSISWNSMGRNHCFFKGPVPCNLTCKHSGVNEKAVIADDFTMIVKSNLDGNYVKSEKKSYLSSPNSLLLLPQPTWLLLNIYVLAQYRAAMGNLWSLRCCWPSAPNSLSHYGQWPQMMCVVVQQYQEEQRFPIPELDDCSSRDG